MNAIYRLAYNKTDQQSLLVNGNEYHSVKSRKSRKRSYSNIQF